MNLMALVSMITPFYESTCSLDELDEKPNHKNNSES